MHWIGASLLMFVSSVALYLSIRKSTTLATPRELNNLAMFFIPLLVYVILAGETSTNFSLSIFEYLLITVQAVFFTYLGNVFSLKGIEYAPNPGYSLIISKSYVVFTTIASVFLFSAPLTMRSVLAIVLIIVFSAVITLGKHMHKIKTDSSWLLYTMGAFFCAGLVSLSSKYLLSIGVPILTLLVLSRIIVTGLIFGEISYKKIAWNNVSSEQLVVLVLIGIFGASFGYYMQVALNLAPNVGYVNAANAGSIALVTIFSALIFKDELNATKLIGVLGVVSGLVLLFVS